MLFGTSGVSVESGVSWDIDWNDRLVAVRVGIDLNGQKKQKWVGLVVGFGWEMA